VVTPPKPPVKPTATYYHSDGHGATALVTPDGNGAWFPDNNGRLVFRKYDSKAKHGTARRVI